MHPLKLNLNARENNRDAEAGASQKSKDATRRGAPATVARASESPRAAGRGGPSGAGLGPGRIMMHSCARPGPHRALDSQGRSLAASRPSAAPAGSTQARDCQWTAPE
jgi:hypothetical protein